MFTSFTIATLAFTLFYFWLFVYFITGWKRLKPLTGSGYKDAVRFSIVIPARNEEANIADCITGIMHQDYPVWAYEIIVVDDCSTDGTAKIVTEMAAKLPLVHIKIIRLGDRTDLPTNSFKKFAISQGIAKSQYPWIITTDADCAHSKYWLASFASFIEENNPFMVSGPVSFIAHTDPPLTTQHSTLTTNHPPLTTDHFFNDAQALEFAGLNAIGAACIKQGSPTMCNGANLAFKKEIFHEVNGYEGIDDIASGDDEFLMHKIAARYQGKVMFMKNNAAIVTTAPQPNLYSFIQQRKRWVSKSRKYTRKGITYILSSAYIFNLIIALDLVLSIISVKYLLLFGIAITVKMLVEYSFLSSAVKFAGRQALMKRFLPASFVYVIYVLFIGIYGNFGTYNWKGRNVK